MNYWKFVRNPENANGLIAVFTALIFLATVAYVVVSIAQWSITQDTLHVDQRAWVGIQEVKGFPKLGEPFEVAANFTNYGKTPALHVVTAINWKWLTPTEEPACLSAPPPNVPYSVLQPGQPGHDEKQVTPKLGADDEELINRGTNTLYVIGRIDYRDIFNNPHWTTYCYHLAPSGREYAVCHSCNHTDEDQ